MNITIDEDTFYKMKSIIDTIAMPDMMKVIKANNGYVGAGMYWYDYIPRVKAELARIEKDHDDEINRRIDEYFKKEETNR